MVFHMSSHNSFGSNNYGQQIGSNSGFIHNYVSQREDLSGAIKRLYFTDPNIGRSNLTTEKRDRVPGACEWIVQ
jgi:hypothetical protein